MGNKVWVVRAVDDKKKPHLEEFRFQRKIAVGWNKLGDLTGYERESIKNSLYTAYPEFSEAERTSAFGSLDAVVNHMRPGDYVLIPFGYFVYIAIVDGEYEFDPDNVERGCPHKRKVKSFTRGFRRDDLSKELRTTLKTRHTVADISKHYDEVKALMEGTRTSAGRSEGVTVRYPLRPDFPVEFSIPANMTQTEAMRLSNFLLTLYFDQTK